MSGTTTIEAKTGYHLTRDGELADIRLLRSLEGEHGVPRVHATFLAAKVPRYKMPKRFFFWEALPKSGYGKIPKRLVRDELEARGLLELVAKSTGA